MPSFHAFFRELFQTFLVDFLRLAEPDYIPHLLLEQIRYPVLDLTGWSDDQRAALGAVADIPITDGTSVTVLIQTEPAPLDPLATARLLARPFLLLEAQCSQPVLLTTVYLHGGRPGLNLESAAIRRLFEMELVRILYTTFGLSESRAEHYLERPEPLAWALAALMRPTQRSRAEHKRTCLERIRGAGLAARETGLLIACVEEWMELQPEDRAEYLALTARDRNPAAVFP